MHFENLGYTLACNPFKCVRSYLKTALYISDISVVSGPSSNCGQAAQFGKIFGTEKLVIRRVEDRNELIPVSSRELEEVGLRPYVREGHFDADWNAYAFVTSTGHRLFRSAEAWALMGPLPLELRQRLATAKCPLHWLGAEVVARTEDAFATLARLILTYLTPTRSNS